MSTNPGPQQPTDIDRYVAAEITLRRGSCGMTMTVLGELVGVSLQQIRNYEAGSDRISAGRLYRIARALGCQPADFYPPVSATEPDPRQVDLLSDVATLDKGKQTALVALSRELARP